MSSLYFDYNATTPIRREVAEALAPLMGPEGLFGNPSSLHSSGQRARAILETARERVASLVGAADSAEIIFTSSGTESDALALMGIAFAHRDEGRHIVTSAVEHHAVLKTLQDLRDTHGFEVTFLPVDSSGRVAVGDLERVLRKDTILVSVMAANNEVGTLQPFNEIGDLCREKRVVFHTDAVQWVGKVPLDLKKSSVDMASLSGHKLYASKGIGALYVRRGIRFHPLFQGSQEKGRRAGTENVPGAVGLGVACALLQKELPTEEPRLRSLRDRLEQGLLKTVPRCGVNGNPVERLGATTNMFFYFVEGESLVLALDQAAFVLKDPTVPGVEISTGSACASGLSDPSHVLKAMGLPREKIQSSVRFSLGRFTTDEHVTEALALIPRVVERLRSLSPLWQEAVS